MKTSYFGKFHKNGGICIARSVPKYLSNVPCYPKLMPGPWFMSVGKERYIYLYRQILEQLNPQVVWDELHAMANGYEPILYCYEKPPFDDKNYCHRRFVAEWFMEKLGVDVPEIGFEKNIPVQLTLL